MDYMWRRNAVVPSLSPATFFCSRHWRSSVRRRWELNWGLETAEELICVIANLQVGTGVRQESTFISNRQTGYKSVRICCIAQSRARMK